MNITDVIKCKVWARPYVCALCGAVEITPECTVAAVLIPSGRPICERCHLEIIPKNPYPAPLAMVSPDAPPGDDPAIYVSIHEAEALAWVEASADAVAETYVAQIDALVSAHPGLDAEAALLWAYASRRGATAEQVES